jgi:hypothetical protein
MTMPEEKERRQAKKTSNSMKLIKELLSPEVVKEKAFMWQEIVAAMADITKTQTEEAEELLVKILESEGAIQLAPESDIPHAMSPKDMLKSLAIQSLSKWTGRKHIRAFERVYVTTKSPILAGTAKVHIEKLGGGLRETQR